MNYTELKNFIKDEIDVEVDLLGFLLGDEGKDIFYNEDKSHSIQFIEQDGGFDGGAGDCYTIVKFDDIFYKISYSYYSHYGFKLDYASLKKVTPKEKTITVYE